MARWRPVKRLKQSTLLESKDLQSPSYHDILEQGRLGPFTIFVFITATRMQHVLKNKKEILFTDLGLCIQT